MRTSIPTRTIGDPATGTDVPIPINRRFSQDDDPSGPSDLQRSQVLNSELKQKRSRPNLIALPRTGFSIDQNSPFPTPSSNIGSLSRSTGFDLEPSHRALVVDDDPLTRTLMKRMLERLGWHVTTAENGDLALGILLGSAYRQKISSDEDSVNQATNDPHYSDSQPQMFAVTFLDNHMPVLSGLQTVAKLRESGRTDFVVGVTGTLLFLISARHLTTEIIANALVADQQVSLLASAP
jgi:osomolarity two-component system, sensor histidine kinase SLN1